MITQKKQLLTKHVQQLARDIRHEQGLGETIPVTANLYFCYIATLREYFINAGILSGSAQKYNKSHPFIVAWHNEIRAEAHAALEHFKEIWYDDDTDYTDNLIYLIRLFNRLPQLPAEDAVYEITSNGK